MKIVIWELTWPALKKIANAISERPSDTILFISIGFVVFFVITAVITQIILVKNAYRKRM